MNLSLGQRIKRRLWLTFASHYYHPDGNLELDIEEKAGIDPTRDDEEAQDRKFAAWNQHTSAKNQWWGGFSIGVFVGAAIVYWWRW